MREVCCPRGASRVPRHRCLPGGMKRHWGGWGLGENCLLEQMRQHLFHLNLPLCVEVILVPLHGASYCQVVPAGLEKIAMEGDVRTCA